MGGKEDPELDKQVRSGSWIYVSLAHRKIIGFIDYGSDPDGQKEYA